MNVRILIAAAAGGVIIGLSPLEAQRTNLWLPADLLAAAKEVDCGPVHGFYDRPGMVMPHFTYGVFPGPSESSAAFWCQRSNEEQYLLVIVRDGGVSDVVPWKNFPDGLSLSETQDMDLSYFHCVQDWNQRGPQVLTLFAPLKTYYDGVATYFYKYGDRWFFRMLH